MKKAVDKQLKRYFLSKFEEMGIEPLPLEAWRKRSNIKYLARELKKSRTIADHARERI